MPALGSYTNVFNTALVILKERGYRLWSNEDETTFFAEKDGWDFTADDPIELLGLIAIYEHHNPTEYKEYWWQIREPWLYDDLPKTKPDFIPVWRRPKPDSDGGPDSGT